MDAAQATTTSSQAAPSTAQLAIGRDELDRPSPYVAGGLALLVGIAVFAFIWRIRKTFGMKE